MKKRLGNPVLSNSPVHRKFHSFIHVASFSVGHLRPAFLWLRHDFALFLKEISTKIVLAMLFGRLTEALNERLHFCGQIKNFLKCKSVFLKVKAKRIHTKWSIHTGTCQRLFEIAVLWLV